MSMAFSCPTWRHRREIRGAVGSTQLREREHLTRVRLVVKASIIKEEGDATR